MGNDEKKINILLVDDKPENLLALEAIIDRDEYNLIKAHSGEEALKNLLKYDFAAILLDVQMPGIDGFKTAKIIKAREKTKYIPILFITANNMESEHIFTGYSIGGIDYILKPFDPMILKAKVDGFVELYKMNQKIIEQAALIAEKNKELEKANSELSKITTELRLSKELANVISDTSIDSMIIVDNEGEILRVNPAVKDMFGYDEHELVGKNISVLLSCKTCDNSQKQNCNIIRVINNLENVLGYENLKEIRGSRKDGKVVPIEIQIGKRLVLDKSIIAFTIRDITDKKKHEEMITHMAYHDFLTDLPNRRKFNEQLHSTLNHAKQTNQTFAIMYVDMDRFKYINDSLGHVTGDKLLPEVANRLSALVREDDFVARIGGDEFSVILPNSNRENTLEIAENILANFNEKPFYIDYYELFITVCIGICIFPYDGEDSFVLMKNADAALYHAKEQGRSKCKMFHSGMDIQSFRMFIMQNDLRKAIESDQLTLVYQPRIELETGIIKSAEALLRWNHPNWGTILSSQFIPLAEENGLIIQIGKWVLKSVCNQIKRWQETGLPPIRIAINFSAQHFLQKDIIDNIKRILNDSGVPPTMLEIKITQAVIIGNEAITSHILSELRKIGIRITIDDFGAEYLSLNYLRRFPVDFVKIDKSFVQDIGNGSADSTALIANMCSLAESLNMSVIADNVGTEIQLNTLRKYNCQEIQGNLISVPLNENEFAAFLLNHKHGQFSDSGQGSNTTDKHNANLIEFPSSPKDASEQSIVKNEDILNASFERIRQLYTISERELDVFKLIVNGLSNKEISEQLFISEHTVKNHITHILKKLDVNDRFQAMALVYKIIMEEGDNLPFLNRKN